MNAQVAYAERRALLEADRTCRLFTASMRSALEAGAGQAAGALLRSGWTMTRLGQLDAAAVSAAQTRPCSDARTVQAAQRARAGFGAYAQTHAMSFPGGSRTWAARRTPDPAGGWMLSQALPGAARFGVRERNGAQELALIVPNGVRAPGAVQLLLRDPVRAATSQMDIPGRLARGLAAGVPAPQNARAFQPRQRLAENGATAFLFAPDALVLMTRLDPREAGAFVFADGRPDLLIEIGDVAAARSFLAARAN